ncbi:MAG TPA: hypothetical protein VN066_02580 [Rhodocyclaceae bacterium]|jgi:hypothetical protein|nr:hypothetical protein [Rhodocyclaceae bacterium]
MAKSQLRGNKEAKKPKQEKKPAIPPSNFLTQTKAATPVKTKG